MYCVSFKFVIIPLIGALIGLVTNYIAIRMLFRPFKKKKIMGIGIPLTPGVIPKEHDKLAEKIGETVGKHLVTIDSLHKVFKSQDVKVQIQKALEVMYDDFGPLAMFLTDSIKETIFNKVLEMFDRELPVILNKLDIQQIVRNKVKEFSLDKLEKIILDVTRKELKYVTFFGGILGFVIGLIQVLILEYL